MLFDLSDAWDTIIKECPCDSKTPHAVASCKVEGRTGIFSLKEGIMASTEPAKKSGLEILKAQPMLERIVFVLNTLDRLHKSNVEQAGGQIAASRANADAKLIARGKAQAYKDTTTFMLQLFKEELKEKFQPEPESVIIQ